MSKIKFDNLIDKEGNQLELDWPKPPNDNLKRLMELESIPERASASGKRLKEIFAKEKFERVLSMLDDVNEKLDELEVKHKHAQAIHDANILIDRVQEILVCWFSNKYEESFKFNDSRKILSEEVIRRREALGKTAEEAVDALQALLEHKGEV